MGLGAEPLGFGRALDLLTVFITPSDEDNLFTLEPLVTGDGITGQGCVCTAQMGPVVDVIERCGERERHAAGIEGSLRRRSGPAPKLDLTDAPPGNLGEPAQAHGIGFHPAGPLLCRCVGRRNRWGGGSPSVG